MAQYYFILFYLKDIEALSMNWLYIKTLMLESIFSSVMDLWKWAYEIISMKMWQQVNSAKYKLPNVLFANINFYFQCLFLCDFCYRWSSQKALGSK